MLGEQSWAKPNTFDTFNTGARLDYDLPQCVEGLCGGKLQPFADRRQRDLCVWLLQRNGIVFPVPRARA